MPTFYRIVLTDPPTRYDSLSDAGRGRSAPRDPELARLTEGLSVYATEAQARRKARGIPTLGGFIAAVDVPDDGSVRHERTTKSSGHYTLWGDPDLLRERVQSVVPVERALE